MFKRLIIIAAGAGFAIYCIAIAFLTLFGKNLATQHLTKLFQIGYAAISAVLTPFGIAGVIGGFSRKKALIRAFITFQWWLCTFVVIGLNVFNIILSKRNKGDFIRRCQNDLAKGQPESEFLTQCTAIVDDAERATFIAACIQGGIMLFLGIVLLIVGIREYGSISLEDETKNLIEKANLDETDVKMDKIESLGDRLSPKTSNPNINGGGIIDTLAPGRYPPTNMTNVRLQPSNSIKVVTTNVDLTRRPTNEITINPIQNSGLRRNPTDLRNQTLMPQLYKDLTRNPTIPGNIPPKRYPTNGSTNITRQPTIGNTYASRNYVAPGALQAAYPTAPQRSLSTKQYVNPPPSYVTQFIIPPPQPSLMNQEIIVSEVNGYNTDYKDYYKDYSDYSDYSDFNDDNDDYVRNPYNSPTKTMAPYLTRMGMK